MHNVINNCNENTTHTIKMKQEVSHWNGYVLKWMTY